jgi:threonine dehydrogenase-like Zn-dependent dehydrogenase
MNFFLKEVHITSSRAYDDVDFKETVAEFVKGSFKGVEKMVTSRIALDDIVEKGFENLVERKDEHIKILVTPKKF